MSRKIDRTQHGHCWGFTPQTSKERKRIVTKAINELVSKVIASPVVLKTWTILENIAQELSTKELPVIINKNPLFWIPQEDFNIYNIEGKIEENPLTNSEGEVASRSCLLSFLSAVRQGQINKPGIHFSIGAYYRFEEVIILGVREPVFPQLEVEIIGMDADEALYTTLNVLQKILIKLGINEYRVKIQGTLPENILSRPEVEYAGVDRQWKLYKTKKNVGFEVYADSSDAITGGGNFTDLAWRFGLNPNFHAVGFGLGLLRIK